MKLWQDYVVPVSVSEALQALASAPGLAVPLAGGTDLLLDLDQGRHAPAHTLVDLTAVAEMIALERRGEDIFIGAAVPLSRIAGDPLVLAHAEALAEACNLIGGPQVRNVATLGGNVAHALPAADGTIALLALDAVAEIASLSGSRRMHLVELFAGAGKSTLKVGLELIVGFHLRVWREPLGSCFNRIMRPQGVALPIINVAACLERRGDFVNAARIAIGPGGQTPWRAREAEDALIGTKFSVETLDRALAALLSKVAFRTSARRASAEYRRHLAVELFRETLTSAWDRALDERGRHEAS
jgi:carbon-monoxide dehydrogenase medium subunit